MQSSGDLLVSIFGECPIMITCSLWALEDIDGSWRIGMLRTAAVSCWTKLSLGSLMYCRNVALCLLKAWIFESTIPVKAADIGTPIGKLCRSSILFFQ